MFIRFNDDGRTMVDEGVVSIFSLKEHKIEWRMKNSYATFEVEYVNPDEAKSDFGKLIRILDQCGFIDVNDNLIRVNNIIAYSNDIQKGYINIALENGSIENIKFNTLDLLRATYISLDIHVSKYVETSEL